MEFTPKERKKLIRFIKATSFKFYKIYRNIFLENCIDIKDMHQELYISAQEYANTIETEGKTKDDFWKLIHGSLNFKCRDILKLTTAKNKQAKIYESVSEYTQRFREENKKVKVRAITYETLLKEICGERDTDIFLKNIIDKYTLDELADEYKLHFTTINKIINNCLTKLRGDEKLAQSLKEFLVA